jgi:small conductance mechanosensitive channel
MILRPFKAGDFVTAGGVTGTVEDIGLFVTTIDTLDNVRNFVGNGKIFAEKTFLRILIDEWILKHS